MQMHAHDHKVLLHNSGSQPRIEIIGATTTVITLSERSRIETLDRDCAPEDFPDIDHILLNGGDGEHIYCTECGAVMDDVRLAHAHGSKMHRQPPLTGFTSGMLVAVDDDEYEPTVDTDDNSDFEVTGDV